VWPALAFLQAEGASELITGYLQDEVLADEPAAVVRALAALAAIGGCTTDDLADATAPVLEGLQSIVRDDVLDRVAEPPLVGRGPIGCWPHPVWVHVALASLLSIRQNRRCLHDFESDRYHGDQSPSGSVVCPTSMRYPSGSRM
jgi:hypothetical protein